MKSLWILQQKKKHKKIATFHVPIAQYFFNTRIV